MLSYRRNSKNNKHWLSQCACLLRYFIANSKLTFVDIFFQTYSLKAYFNSDNGFIEIKSFYKITHRNFKTPVENNLLDIYTLSTEFHLESYSYKRNDIHI